MNRALRLAAAATLLACSTSCHRKKQEVQALPEAGDAGVAASAPVPPPPPVWRRAAPKLPPIGRQAAAAQILIGWKGSAAPWAAPRARQRTLDEARELAGELAAKARAGADFALLAVKYSDWPLADRQISAGYGGRLGVLTEGTKGYPEAFDRIFRLKVGEVSEPVPSSYGLHVFKRLPAIRLSEILITHEGAGQLHAPRSAAEARQIADKVEGELASGKSFAEEAEAYSEDPGSAGRGGDIGTFERVDLLPPALRDAARGLRVDQRSAPVETPAGLAILERTE